jgi:Protein of unknown function (DUF1579)
MQTALQTNSQWLDLFIGEWISETAYQMAPDQPFSKTEGTESVRSLGGLWILAEGQSEMPDRTTGTTLITLGYDPQSQRYVGTFVGSMMTHLWLYNGTRNATGNVLTLDTEGPNFTQSAMAKYQDIIEFVNADHRIMTSQILGDDGNWLQFMTAHYRRQN